MTGIRMGAVTIAVLRQSVDDTEVIGRYRSHITVGGAGECHLWTGAISGKGHGRFYLASTDAGQPPGRRTHVVIAHRFGYALQHSVDVLLDAPMVAHRCDNPLCQNPDDHWQPSNSRGNTTDYVARRSVVRGPLADIRGARGRSHAIRAAARNGADVTTAVLAGMRPVHREQLALFDSLPPDVSVDR